MKMPGRPLTNLAMLNAFAPKIREDGLALLGNPNILALLSSHNVSFKEDIRKKPNAPKLSDRGVRRGTCMVGGKAAAEAGAVTHGAVRCSAWLGDVRCMGISGRARRCKSG